MSALFAVSVNAYGYGDGGAAGGASLGGNGGNSLGSGSGSGSSNGYGATGNLAVITKQQQVRYVDVPSRGNAQPTSLNIESQSGPVNLNFQSFSSQVNLQHRHVPAQGSFRQTDSQDEPHRLKHTVTKPIIQEVREIISPRRIVQQQVLPVQEQIQV